MEGYPFLKLLLRVLTVRDMFERNFEETHLEPSLNDRGRRNNGGCDQDDPNCVLTWDGWARAMITGDVLKEVLDRNIPGAVVEVGGKFERNPVPQEAIVLGTAHLTVFLV